tara:strand:+ start:668 stop:898 length:231 start_codon:yes stop_codon:yes gene_type:complete
MLSKKIYSNNTVRLTIKNNIINTISKLEYNYLKNKKYEMSESHVSPFVRTVNEDFIILSEKPFVRLRSKKVKDVTK